MLEGASLLRALRQTKCDAASAERPIPRYVRTSRDPAAKTVVFEDSAAVGGVILALSASGSHQLTGSAAPDAIAAIPSASCSAWWRSGCGATRAGC